MKNILFLYSIITSCTVMHQPNKMRQGITGSVLLRQGNYMPAPGRKMSEGKPVSRFVFIYALTKQGQTVANGTLFNRIQTKLIAKVKSNEAGTYAAELPPGNYSVFVEDSNRLYANNFDDKGNINAVEVKKDSVSKRNIIISTNAVY